ncbi:MAG TPA: ABC transporter permease [Vicinamibacterales bacterium]|nr:ABC transporter permease [Vicinamibacterales bacterium]
MAIALLGALSPLVPVSRRRVWIEQWRAELWHYALWLQRERASCAALRLLARASGAAAHALHLRLADWSPRMIVHDLRFAWRMFVRRPAFTAVAVLILALGIGANTTIFSWIQSVLFSPLGGVVRQDRIVVVRTATAEREGLSLSYPNFQDLRAAKPEGLADVMAFRLASMSLRAGGDPVRAFGALVSANYFDFLGVRPVLGRGFTADEGIVPDRDPVVVISHEFWTRVFGADPAVVGRSVTMNSRAFTVVGVTPPEFHGPVASVMLDVYVPVTMQRAVLAGHRLPPRGGGWLDVYARLADGASLEQARESVGVVGMRLADQFPDANRGRHLRVIPLWRSGTGSVLLPVFTTLMAVVGVVLLIASANVAGLLLARGISRQREIAVRFALGASRWQVVRQMLIETLMLSAAGCVLGLAAARWTSGLLDVFVPRMPFPLRFDAHVDSASVVFAIAVAVASAVSAGVVPALRSSRVKPGPALKDATPATSGRSGGLRRGLVIAQVSLSVVLLVCASLFTRSLLRSDAMDPGFSLRTGLLAAIDLAPGGYDADRGAVFVQQLIDRVGSLPGVTAATVARTIPLDVGGSSDMSVAIDGYTPRQDEEVTAYYNQVGPRYFETMGIPIVRGRAIAPGDVGGQRQVAVINETMARRYWPAGDPIGAIVRFGSGPVTIVGVARDGKYSRLSEAPRNYMYLPALQNYRSDLLLHVRSDADAAVLLPAVRAAVRELDPNLALFDVRTVQQHLRISTFLARMAASVLGVFGALGLLLAAVGLYGVIAFNAAQRTREMGVRMALGASRSQVVSLLLWDGFVLGAAGIAAGLAMALGAGRLVAGQLTGVSGADPVSFWGTAAIFVAVTTAACLLPARRAARLDPLAALRQE